MKFISVFISGLCFVVHSQNVIHRFEGQVIRSYAIHHSNSKLMLVGMKGENPGDGKVYLSRDAGDTWAVTNKGFAIDDSVDDVQCVGFFDEKIFLAGTWKHGLFMTSNSGKTWKNIPFPENQVDIRSMTFNPKTGNMLIASTKGLYQLGIQGGTQTFIQVGNIPGSWSITYDKDRDDIYAMTFEQGVKGVWKILPPTIQNTKPGFLYFDLCIDSAGVLYAVGSSETENSIIYSPDRGQSWDEIDGPDSASYSCVEWVDGKLLVGSWNYPVLKFEYGEWDTVDWVEAGTMTKIKATRDYIYYFTWGNGLYRQSRSVDCDITIDNKITFTESVASWHILIGCSIESIQLKLYNRWGEEILNETSGSASGLLEKINASGSLSNLTSDVYLFIADITREGNVEVIGMSGNVTIIR